MIKRIQIKNFILIDNVTIDLSKGLNVITGETGSGKSILINAIDAVFGAKISKDVIKSGTDKSVIEVTMSINSDLSLLFNEFCIDDLGDEIIISREISLSSSRTRVNGTLVNTEFIKRLRELCLDIHSQHQTYSFVQPAKHIKLLDEYSKDIYGTLLTDYKDIWSKYQDVLSNLKKAENSNQLSQNQIDFLKFQIQEIEDASVEDVNEYDNLQNELSILTNSERLKEYLTGAFWTLSEDDNSILNNMMKVKNFISKASSFDEKLVDVEGSIVEYFDALKDVSYELNSYVSKLEYDETRINEIQERISILDKIKRKYGNTLSDVLNTYNNLLSELEKFETSDAIILKLKQEAEILYNNLIKIATDISKKRMESAKKLSKLVVDVLEKLELPKSKFEILLSPCDLYSEGIDNVEFLISTNISEPVKPLSKVASGGEISRVMLAIKSIFAQHDDIDTVIFDEIDTGISGKASIAVSEKIAELSNYRQVILITHQAIIASKADNHIYVSKSQDDVTTVNIKVLSDKEKISALAELASGQINEKSLDFARSLVQ